MYSKLVNNIPVGKFTLEFVDQNPDNYAPLYEGGFAKPIWNGTTYVESGTNEEVKENLKKEIKAKYEFHRTNGWNAYQNFRAIIVSDIYDGKISEPQAFIIEQFLKVAYDRISQNGDWKTARHELGQITGYPSFVNEYYDLALQFIDDYITNNYDS